MKTTATEILLWDLIKQNQDAFRLDLELLEVAEGVLYTARKSKISGFIKFCQLINGPRPTFYGYTAMLRELSKDVTLISAYDSNILISLFLRCFGSYYFYTHHGVYPEAS